MLDSLNNSVGGNTGRRCPDTFIPDKAGGGGGAMIRDVESSLSLRLRFKLRMSPLRCTSSLTPEDDDFSVITE